MKLLMVATVGLMLALASCGGTASTPTGTDTTKHMTTVVDTAKKDSVRK